MTLPYACSGNGSLQPANTTRSPTSPAEREHPAEGHPGARPAGVTRVRRSGSPSVQAAAAANAPTAISTLPTVVGVDSRRRLELALRVRARRGR